MVAVIDPVRDVKRGRFRVSETLATNMRCGATEVAQRFVSSMSVIDVVASGRVDWLGLDRAADRLMSTFQPLKNCQTFSIDAHKNIL